MEDLGYKLNDLNLNSDDESKIVKKVVKKANIKNKKKKDSFINDSSEEDIEEEEYIPANMIKTRSACRRVVLRKDKITPTKKAIYISSENSKNTRKK